MTNAEFEKIYQAYFQPVYRYLLKLSQDQQLAEEITGETFFKAMHAVDRFKGKCDIGTWLCQIAKNTYYAYQKANSKTVPLDSIAQSAGEDIEECFASSELSMRILKALHKIDEPYREVFTLRVLGELRFKQIADVFGKTENWACVTYHRAKNKIYAILEEE